MTGIKLGSRQPQYHSPTSSLPVCGMNVLNNAAVFVARALCKTYRMGEIQVQALRPELADPIAGGWPGIARNSPRALFRRGDDWSTFVVADGHARLRIIQLGPRGALQAVVENGLEPGERVAVYPSDAVRDGARVRTREPRTG